MEEYYESGGCGHYSGCGCSSYDLGTMCCYLLCLIVLVVILYTIYSLRCQLRHQEGLLSNYDTRTRFQQKLDEVGRLDRAYTQEASYKEREHMGGLTAGDAVNVGTNPHGEYRVDNVSLAKQLYQGN